MGSAQPLPTLDPSVRNRGGASGLYSEISSRSGVDKGGQRGRLKPGPWEPPLSLRFWVTVPCVKTQTKNANNHTIPLARSECLLWVHRMGESRLAWPPALPPAPTEGASSTLGPASGLRGPRRPVSPASLVGWERLEPGGQGHPRGILCLGPGKATLSSATALMEMRRCRKCHWLLP